MQNTKRQNHAITIAKQLIKNVTHINYNAPNTTLGYNVVEVITLEGGYYQRQMVELRGNRAYQVPIGKPSKYLARIKNVANALWVKACK